MSQMTNQGTLPVANTDMLAAPITDTLNHIMNTYNGKNIQTENVDTTGANGIVDIPTAQTITGAKTFTDALTVGVDDTGHDVKFFGATTGKSWLWDESLDKMVVTGDASVSGATTLTGAL